MVISVISMVISVISMVISAGISVIPVTLQNLICLEIAAMAAILDIGTELFSNSESPCHPNASHQVSAQSELQLGRICGLKNFKMVAILDIGTEHCSNSEFP